jgi:F-type H+-transporting ATPase subunit beta
VTTFLIDPRGEAVDVDEPYGPLDTLWLFDAELIKRKMYPAINPVLSTSTVLEDTLLESQHMAVQQQIRKVLRKYRSIRSLGEAYGYEKLPTADMRDLEMGKRLEAYLTQPFFVAEPFTKKKGESLVLEEMLNDLEFILNGGTDKKKVEDLYFIGKLKRGK